MTNFWDIFYEQPIENVPWNKTQADWFVKLIEEGKVSGKTALDVGCGVGAKSVYLAQHGFDEIVGVDISSQAIEHARDAVEKSGVSNKCTFFVHDASDLSFLPASKQFDLVLDWAVIHCLPAEQLIAYATMVTERILPDGHLLVRAFSAEDGRDHFIENVGDQTENVSIFTEDRLLKLFNQLEVVDKNISKPRTKADLKFLELLFKKN